MIVHNKLLIFLLTIILISCNDLNNNARLKNEKIITELKGISTDWKRDSIGCINLRKLILKENKLLYDSLNNLDIGIALDYLGQPNFERKFGSISKFYYCISCKYAPPVKYRNKSDTIKRISSEAEMFYIDFNSDSIIINSGLMIP